jgi:hypothetical protein
MKPETFSSPLSSHVGPPAFFQKYRTHRRHMLQSKEGEATNWQRRPAESAQWTRARRDSTAWLGVSSHQPPIQPRPAQLPLPPLHSGPHMAPPLHVWGHPTVDHSGGHMWHTPHMGMPSPPWMGGDGVSWQHPSETWGHPTAPHLVGGWPHGPPLMMKGGMHPAPGNPWVHPPPLMIKMAGPGQGEHSPTDFWRHRFCFFSLLVHVCDTRGLAGKVGGSNSACSWESWLE